MIADGVVGTAAVWTAAIATASAALYMGATVVFADIDSETYQLDAARAEAAITERTRAVIAVHLYGRLADMDAILSRSSPAFTRQDYAVVPLRRVRRLP